MTGRAFAYLGAELVLYFGLLLALEHSQSIVAAFRRARCAAALCGVDEPTLALSRPSRIVVAVAAIAAIVLLAIGEPPAIAAAAVLAAAAAIGGVLGAATSADGVDGRGEGAAAGGGRGGWGVRGGGGRGRGASGGGGDGAPGGGLGGRIGGAGRADLQVSQGVPAAGAGEGEGGRRRLVTHRPQGRVLRLGRQRRREDVDARGAHRRHAADQRRRVGRGEVGSQTSPPSTTASATARRPTRSSSS